MNIAEEYFRKQLSVDGFGQSYLEEKVKLDIEYQLEELKKDILSSLPISDIIKKIDHLEEYVMSV